MIRFLLGLGMAVAVVVLLARFLGSWTSWSQHEVHPDLPAAAVEQTCDDTGGRSIVRVLPDQSIEAVACK